MKGIAIYVEGGGMTAEGRQSIRVGFDRLLGAQKRAAQLKHIKWKLVASGSRNDAYSDFINAIKLGKGEILCVLLVDSEESIPAELSRSANETKEAKKRRRISNATARRDHLVKRDRWDLSIAPVEHIHLMVRCMETWIVADVEKLTEYYVYKGAGFHAKALPARGNLEDESKESISDKLKNATEKSNKGEYSKIKHASALLGLIRPDCVRSRCPRFATLIEWLDEQIQNAR